MKCAVCGSTATKLNKSDIPVCGRHANSKIKSPNCPNCGLQMKLRESKYGKFWGCTAFPMCNGMKKI
ncbi:MAG: topoisomerase DNA-binding C4 zinc finger domain-containing protein [Candidatus Diapherotrites archaeon]|nr:topoisomerase DNA-binding C4 zinc finger domain-containing protein [Candidatus Diapherotrites archaeon]